MSIIDATGAATEKQDCPVKWCLDHCGNDPDEHFTDFAAVPATATPPVQADDGSWRTGGVALSLAQVEGKHSPAVLLRTDPPNSRPADREVYLDAEEARWLAKELLLAAKAISPVGL